MSANSQHHARAGRIVGLTRAVLRTNEEGRKAAVAAARMARLDAMVPDHITNSADRARSANLLLRAEMTRLAKLSAEKRRRKPRLKPAN